MSICLVCSSGGHFYELYCLRDAWGERDRFWVTFPSQDTRSMLSRERVYRAYSPTNRHIRNMFRNLFLAWRILTKEKPYIIVSTGAGICVPFFFLGKVMRIRTVYIESLARVRDISLSGRMVYPFADDFLVQWPELARRYPRAKFKGQLL